MPLYLIGLSILFALVCFFVGRSLLAYKSRRWPFVMGSFTDVQFEKVDDVRYPCYELRVQYRYTVDGKEYTGKCIGARCPMVSYHIPSKTLRGVLKILRPGYDPMPQCPYRVEDSVRVYFDPEDPRSAALDPGMNAFVKQNIVFGIIIVLLIVLAWVFDLGR